MTAPEMSFDAALAALDVEPTHHTDKMITTHIILGLDDVRAAHRAEVDRLSARVAKLEAALRFYAGRLTYAAHYSYSGGPTYAILDDGGDTARAALEPTQSGSERSDEEDKS